MVDKSSKVSVQNDVKLKALKSGYAVLDLNSYNLWGEHQILNSSSSFTKRRVEVLAWNSFYQQWH